MSKKHLQSRLINIYQKLYKFYGPQGWWPGDTQLEVIVGAILTQNTAWTNVEKAIRNLKKTKALASVSGIKNTPIKKLAKLIRPAGYYNLKADRLKNFTNFLSSKYGLSLPRLSRQNTSKLKKELLSINGIGPETCDSILLYAFKRPVFVVDAYTKRIFSRHHCFPQDASYEEVQKIFEDNLPKSEKIFNEFHALIVRLAKDFCRKTPICSKCPLRQV